MATPCSIGCGFEATGFGTVVTSSPIGLPVTLLIRADELCIGQHMPFHRLLDLGFGRPFEIERDIQRIKLVEVAVLTDRRTPPYSVFLKSFSPTTVPCGSPALLAFSGKPLRSGGML